MELGYEFFLDRETLKSKFLVADIFKGAEQGEPWTSLEKEKADIIHCSAFFHLFPLPDQIRAAKNVARLVRPNGIIVGRQSGSVKPGEVPAIAEGSTSFRHDISSLQSMWDEVGRATDTEWKVSGTLDTVGMIAKKNAVEDENSLRCSPSRESNERDHSRNRYYRSIIVYNANIRFQPMPSPTLLFFLIFLPFYDGMCIIYMASLFFTYPQISHLVVKSAKQRRTERRIWRSSSMACKALKRARWGSRGSQMGRRWCWSLMAS